MGEGMACPHCGQPTTAKWGRDKTTGLQRWMCWPCKRTFNERTGTPLARMRKRDEWIQHARLFAERRSIQDVAEILHIGVQTAFKWRHRMIRAMEPTVPDVIGGTVEADETYFRRSFKGDRRAVIVEGREPRKRGSDQPKRGLGRDKVAVLTAINDDGERLAIKLDQSTQNTIAAQFGSRLDGDAVLCTDASSALSAFAAKQGVYHFAFNASKGQGRSGVYNIQAVNAYHSSIKRWMTQFCGVSTRWLQNYMTWHAFATTAGPKQLAETLRLAVGPTTQSICPLCGRPMAPSTV